MKAASVFIFCLMKILISASVWAVEINSSELIRKAQDYDGSKVAFKGEVIGDVMRRGSSTWFNVEDNEGAIGVLASTPLAEVIEQAGDYQHRGDIVRIEGTFFRADPKQGGELYIRAQNIRVLSPGYRLVHSLNPIKIEIAVILSVGALALAVFSLVVYRRRKNLQI